MSPGQAEKSRLEAEEKRQQQLKLEAAVRQVWYVVAHVGLGYGLLLGLGLGGSCWESSSNDLINLKPNPMP